MKRLVTQPFINGELDQSPEGSLLPQINPATEEAFTEVRGASLSTLEKAIEGAQQAFEQTWKSFGMRERADVLCHCRSHTRKPEALATLESHNIGKPICDARDEIELGSRIFEYYAGAISKAHGQTLPVAKGGLDLTPGSPWEWSQGSFHGTSLSHWCWKVAPALAAGNTVVLKPASISALTALALGQLAHEAGLPAGVLQVIRPGQRDWRSPGPTCTDSKISFTGSTESGARIMAMVAPEIKRVSLELGGKSPNIVFADADLSKAASQSPLSVFANTGQDCCARSRVFVEASIYDTFVEQFLEATRTLKVGDPLSDETQLGPMVSAAQRSSVESATLKVPAPREGRWHAEAIVRTPRAIT